MGLGQRTAFFFFNHKKWQGSDKPVPPQDIDLNEGVVTSLCKFHFVLRPCRIIGPEHYHLNTDSHDQLHPSRVVLERCHDTCVRSNDQDSTSHLEPHSWAPPVLDRFSQCTSVSGMDRVRTTRRKNPGSKL